MQNNNNNNILLARKLEKISQDIASIDEANIHESIALIQIAYNELEIVAVENNLHTLRNITDWVFLNTIVDGKNNIEKHEALLQNNDYARWIDVLAKVLNENDFSLLPTLHKNLTSPDWIKSPSSHLLKDVATWLTEIKANSELKEINEEASMEVESYFKTDTNEANSENQDVFDSIDIKSLENEYISVLPSDADQDLSDFQIPLMATEKNNLDESDFETPVLADKNTEVDLIEDDFSNMDLTLDQIVAKDNNSIDSDLEIDDKLLTENDILIESFSNPKDANNSVDMDELIGDNDNQDHESISVSDDAQITVNELEENTEVLDMPQIVDDSSAELDSIQDSVQDSEEQSENDVLIESFSNPKDTNNSVDTDELIVDNNSQEHDHESMTTSDDDQLTVNELEENTEVLDMPQIVDTSSAELDSVQDSVQDNEEQTIDAEVDEETSDFKITWDDGTHPELLMVYLEETPTQIAELIPLLDKVSNDEANEEDKTVATRLAHSIKGGSAVVGITALSEFSYRLETLLDHSKKYKIDDEIRQSLPAVGNYLESLFDAVQMQDKEPKGFFTMFTKLDNYVSTLEEDDEILELNAAPVLPDFITAQNNKSEELETEAEQTVEVEETVNNSVDMDELIVDNDSQEHDHESMTTSDDDQLTVNELEENAEVLDMPQIVDTSSAGLDSVQDSVQDNEEQTIDAEVDEETSDFKITWDDGTHPELLMVYLEETPTQIAELIPLLDKVSNDEANEEDKTVATRLAHSIKGGSAVVGITALSEFSYRLETLLDHSKKYKIDDEIRQSLPAVGNYLESLFDAVQMQDKEPKGFFTMFTKLDNYVSTLEEDDEILELNAAPVLPDFITAQNNKSEELETETEQAVKVEETVNEETDEVEESEVAENKQEEIRSDESSEDSVETAEEQTEKSGFQLNWDDDVHPELLMVYLEETPTQINELVPLMKKISEGNADADEKHTASRMAHTIKGGSAIVGITALSEIAYRLESLLDHSVKNELPSNILNLLPETSSCLEELFEAVQMQDEEPANYFSIFKQLDEYINVMEEENPDNDEPLELSAPVLPDFIVNQNLNDTTIDEATDEKAQEAEKVIAETEAVEETEEVITETEAVEETEEVIAEAEAVEETEEVIAETEAVEEEIIESVSVEAVKLEKLESKEDIKDIVEEIDDMSMNLMTISTSSASKKAKLKDYTVQLERFDLLTEMSGYPELSLLSEWCQSNLEIFTKKRSKEISAFIESGDVWLWIGFISAALKEPEDMSHLSSLSVELMRDDWALAIEMDDLQTVLLALRNIEQQENTAIDTEYVAEDSTNTDIVSWDKDVHPELLAVYFKETPDQIFEVASLLHKISKGESSTEENKKAARIAHTIKGASGVVGLNSLVELTHVLEDILDYSVTNDISEDTAELLAESSDGMESLFEAIQNKQATPEELPSLLERLYAFSSSIDNNNSSFALSSSDAEEAQKKLSIKTIDTPKDKASDTPNAKQASKVNINEAHIRVPVRIIDKLLNLAGELVTTSNQVSDGLAKSLATNNSIKNQDDRINKMLGELSNTITEQEKDQHKLLLSIENSDFDSLEMDTYNELHSVASLLSESFMDSQEIDNTLNRQLNELSDKLRSLDKLNKDFSDVILSSRMVSINTIVPRLERIVRQTCRKTKKKANLVVTGNDIYVDTEILNGLIDPLLHMLRNSIDHGIETPKKRKKAKKDETGLIELDFTQDGNNIVMTLKDDGAGIDPKVIRQKAIEKELITKKQQLSKRETLNLILQAGFSTQENVTDISGRGVGMDVVNSSVAVLNGTLGIDSELGKGSTFDLSIPLTLITNTTLQVNAGDSIVAIPIDTIEQVIYQEANTVITRDDKNYVMFEDKEIEIKSLGQLLEWSNYAIDFTISSNILIIKSGKEIHAIHVDNILSSREVVVKPLNPWVSPVKGVIGACHLNDGGVAPVVNLINIIKYVENKNKSKTASKESKPQIIAKPSSKQHILVVDDSLSNRKALSLIIDKTEYNVVTAVDGMDALQIMNEQHIDLVFTDLEMPRMNGVELTQAIRAWTDKSKTPIVMITSRTTTKHRELAKKAGVDDYLTKPVVKETLLDSIDTWLVEKESVEA